MVARLESLINPIHSCVLSKTYLTARNLSGLSGKRMAIESLNTGIQSDKFNQTLIST